MKVFEAKERRGEERRGEEDTFMKCLLHWATVQVSSAAAGRGSEDRSGGGEQSGSTQRGHKVSLIFLRSGQRAA